MSKNRMSMRSQKQPDDRLKKLMKLEKHYQEWKNDFTIDYCFTSFLVYLIEKGDAQITIYNYKSFYRKYTQFLAEVFKSNPKEMTVEVLDTQPHQAVFMNWLKGKGLQQSTINCLLRNLRAFGKWCVEEGYLLDFKCPIKNVPTPIKEVYTTQELQKLLVKPPITDFIDFRAYCMICLMLNTGARRRTISNIKICDFEEDTGYINFNTTKTGKVVRLGLDRKAKRDIIEFLHYYRLDKGATENDYLFCNEYGEQLHPNSITIAIAKYNKKRGVEKTSVHLFRHTFAKNWITSGGDIITLARVLTHKELDMVQHYSNLYAGDIKKEIEEHSVLSQMRTRSGKTLKNQQLTCGNRYIRIILTTKY